MLKIHKPKINTTNNKHKSKVNMETKNYKHTKIYTQTQNNHTNKNEIHKQKQSLN